MKKIHSNILGNMLRVILMATAAAALTSCDDDLAQAPTVLPAPEIGDGTWQNPLQAWQAHLGTTVGDRTSNWVTGYIVGYVDTDNGNKVMIGTAGAVQSNMVIAQYPCEIQKDETGKDIVIWPVEGYSADDCVSVQLPSGTMTRTTLNLADHPENLNKQVSLRGTTGSKYCGIYGIRTANDFNYGAIGRYEPPVEEIAGEYYCNFTASRDINFYIERGWATYMTKGGLTGWAYKESGGVSFVTISAYYGSATGGPYENWIVSPAFDLDTANEKTLSFSTQASTQADTTLEVFLLTSQNPQGCEPQKLECVIAEAPSSGYSAWTSSGTIDLSEYDGTIYIGFRYLSVHGGSGNSSDYSMTDFNLGGADPAEWEIVDPATIGDYREATSIESGKQYLLVFEGDQMMLPISGNFGNFGVREVQFNADGTITAKHENAFTFEAVEGTASYALIQADGRYAFMKGTYTNFNVGVAPEEAYLWSVTAAPDGGFEVLNVNRNLMLYYDATKRNIGTIAPSSYSGTGIRLYEIAE